MEVIGSHAKTNAVHKGKVIYSRYCADTDSYHLVRGDTGQAIGAFGQNSGCVSFFTTGDFVFTRASRQFRKLGYESSPGRGAGAQLMWGNGSSYKALSNPRRMSEHPTPYMIHPVTWKNFVYTGEREIEGSSHGGGWRLVKRTMGPNDLVVGIETYNMASCDTLVEPCCSTESELFICGNIDKSPVELQIYRCKLNNDGTIAGISNALPFRFHNDWNEHAQVSECGRYIYFVSTHGLGVKWYQPKENEDLGPEHNWQKFIETEIWVWDKHLAVARKLTNTKGLIPDVTRVIYSDLSLDQLNGNNLYATVAFEYKDRMLSKLIKMELSDEPTRIYR